MFSTFRLLGTTPELLRNVAKTGPVADLSVESAGRSWATAAASPTVNAYVAATSLNLLQAGSGYSPVDDLFANQWYLNNTGQFGATLGVDINVMDAWNSVTGAGVIVGVYDSGIQYTHHDLDGNYDASRSVIIGGVAHDGFGDPATDDPHGINVAGLIAAENDGVGTVGVAFDASLTGIDFDQQYSSANFLTALRQMTNFDVTNHSYGYATPFSVSRLIGGFYQEFVAAFRNAADTGRGGLGSIAVHAGGNDRTNQFTSGAARDGNDDNLTNSRYAISVGAIAIDGVVTHYSTPGAALLVAAPVAGADGQIGAWTTDYLGANGYNTGTDTDAVDNATPDYDGTMNGTFAASPIVAGVVALMLEANPNLGWRDVKSILAITARHVGSDVGAGHTGNGMTTWELNDWTFNASKTWNGGGMHFSNDYGFGLVDASAAVRLAQSWTSQSASANEATFGVAITTSTAIPDNNPTGASFVLDVTGKPDIDLEHVTIEIDWSSAHTWSGDLTITLTSPDGTVSYILNKIGTAFNASNGSSRDLGAFEFSATHSVAWTRLMGPGPSGSRTMWAAIPARSVALR